MKKIIATVLACSLLFPNLVSAEEKKAEAPPVSINTPSAILVNADTGDILFEKNADKNYDAASLTKVMSMALFNEDFKSGKLKENEKVKVSSKAWRTGGSRMFIEVGYSYPAIELFKGLAIVSGNDAAVALSEHVSGSTEAFAKRMNKKAAELKMKNSQFYSPNGLGDGKHFDNSTVRDLAKLATYYVNEFPDRMSIHGTKEYTTKTRTHPIKQENHNPLLESYQGATGLKTGMINGNYNLIGTASRNKINLIVVMLGSKSASERSVDSKKLLDYGFSQYQTLNRGKKGDEVGHLTVYKAKNIKETKVVLKDDISFVVYAKQASNIEVKDELPKNITGGKDVGDVIGKRIVKVNDKTYTSDIVVNEKIEKAGLVQSFFDSLALFFQWGVNLVFG